MLPMTSQMCCKSVGTDLSMLDIDDFITEICQLKKEVKLLEEKLRTRGDELNTEIVVKVESNPTDAQDTVCDSNHTLNQDESTDQTSTESLDSVCNAGEQQILNTRPLNMCSVTLMDCRKLMEMRRQTTVKEEQTDEDQALFSSVKLMNGGNMMEMKTEPTSEEEQTDEDENHDEDFIPSGRGVFALDHTEPSAFVVECRGVLSESKHIEDIEDNNMFGFTWDGIGYCIDASTEDGSLGPLVDEENSRVEDLNVECSSSEESKCDEENTLYSEKSAKPSADDSRQNSASDENLSTTTQNTQLKNPKTTSAVSKPSKRVPKPTSCLSTKQDTISDNSSSSGDITCDDDHDTTPTKCADIDRKDTFSTHKNYCYVCKKPQSKIARHFQKHQDTQTEIAAALALPKHSKDRKRLLEKLRNRGNYEHNQEVMMGKTGPLKVRRRPVRSEIGLRTEAYVHCVYCRGLFVRKELWRHTRRCPSKICSESEATGKANVLILADIAESTFSQAISPEVCEILADMKNDDISSVVRNDFLIRQLSQCLYNRHRSDPTKSEYITQKVREMGRLLLSLRRKFSIFSFEDAVKPNSFYKVIEAVKDVSGYDEKSHSYKRPSFALKLRRLLNNIGDIVLCRAIAAEDDDMTRAAKQFKRLCSNEWAECVSHAALAALSKSKSNKPSSLLLTQDVQLLNQYLEEKSSDAFYSLKEHESTKTYEELAKLTLARVVIFNRRQVGEVSKMTVECFLKRHQTELHQDISLSLSPFERKLPKRFSRVEIMDQRGTKVAVLLNPELARAMQLILDKRDACDVDKDNPFLFGRPNCSAASFFSGQDCIRLFAHLCGAQNPEDFMSTQLCKQVATMSQIFSLKDNELDQLARFLGLDIRLHRDDFRLPEATLEIAKISKLLLAMEKGTLATFQGKSLDEIEIEDEIDLELNEEEISHEENEESDSLHAVMGIKRRIESTQDEAETSTGIKRRIESTQDEAETSNEPKIRRIVRPWRPNEVNAVMKHFKGHILKGHFATKAECQQCRNTQDPVLRDRTLQNIRDFVRNRGLMLKKKCS